MKPIYTLIFYCFFTNLTAQSRIYVNYLANGINTGMSWQDAYSDLGLALESAQDGDTLWVSKGAYFPGSGTKRDTAFIQKSGVRMFGGFSGTETALQQRNWMSNPTILDGDIGVPGDSSDNVYTILYMDNPDSTTVLDGFVLKNGNADYSNTDQLALSPFKCGAALYIMGANGWAYPLIQNCRFEHNYAYSHGGAVYINGSGTGSAAPQFINCIFESNHARLDGGALHRNGGSWAERSPDFGNCRFQNNYAERRGGGLCFSDSERTDKIELLNCAFIGNSAFNVGGGANFNVGRTTGSNISLEGCLFEKNGSQTDGNAYSLSSLNGQVMGVMKVDSCSFLNNMSNNHVYLIWDDVLFGDIKITKSFFSNNFGSSIMNLSTYSSNEIFNCQFYDNIISSTFIYCNKNSKIQNNRIIEYNPINILRLNFSQNIPLSYINNNLIISPISIFLLETTSGEINVFNNTIIAKGLMKNFPSALTNINIQNNIILNWTDYSNINDANAELFFDNNLFDSNFLCQNPPSSVTCGPNNLFGLNPLFRDTANGDYSLLPCSPLINAGSNAAAAGLLTDITGAPRIQEGTVDIGAYESPAFALAATPSIQPACAGSPGGGITISPDFGCEPYTYQWQPAVGNGPEVNGLPVGDYAFTVTDARGRAISDTISVGEAPSPVLSPLPSNLQCGSIIGGLATVQISNGTAPFSFLWSNAATDSLVTMLPAGQYQVTVTDANGCQDSTQMTISKQGQITLMVNGVPISCFGETDAILSATPANGKAPFSFLWSQGAMDSLLTDLGPGMYTVTATDFYGCTSAFTYNVESPILLQTVASATPTNNLQNPNGTASVASVSGGTQAFTYQWSNGSSGLTISGLAEGVYTVTVTDAHGCTATATAEVEFMVGTSEIADIQVLVWPNPMRERLEIQALDLPSGNWRFVLRDVLGREVAAESLSGGRAVLATGSLAAGMYEWSLMDAALVVASGKVLKREMEHR